MKNPLRHRLLRELKSDLGKYLVIFVFMVLSISEVSGFLVADESMLAAYNESFETYHIEDGNFTAGERLTSAEAADVEALGVRLFELFYVERQLENGGTVRIFENRKDVDLACVMEGRLAENGGEIAIDRLYAENNGLRVGDTIADGGRSWEITGLVALSDYSTLFESNSDVMFDATMFGVAVVSEAEFADLADGAVRWRYAWKYNETPEGEREEKAASDVFLKGLAKLVDLRDYTPRYLNQAINFTGEDMGSDRAMFIVFLYIIIAIIAFVFGITISSTIAAEACVIGTLRASGYTKRELIRHYMTMPLIVTLISAALGNILGYTVLKNANAAMYYGSYSLPTYVTRWNANAFFETTVIPVLLMLVIDYCVLRRKLSLSPLKFIRRDLRKGRSRNAAPLSPKIPFFGRFRIRVIFQNLPNYVLLFIGILFANLLLLFGMMMPSLLRHYEASVPDMMLADYQYILQLPAGTSVDELNVGSLITLMKFKREVETANPDAEKFSAYSLRTLPDGLYNGEDILLYGIDEESAYVPLRLEAGEVAISSAYADKLGVAPGDTITLAERYEDKTYSLTVTGIYDYDSSLCVFMPREDLNELAGLGKGMFAGYFSRTPITDIDEAYIGQRIDLDTMTKVSRQLLDSMGNMMGILDAFSVVMFLILLYLLSKIIIEKNSQAISMAKILGYSNREIGKLYLAPTTILVAVFIVLSLPIITVSLVKVFKIAMMVEMTGWIPIYLDNKVYIAMTALGMGAYGVVAALEYRKIQRVPMDEALKNVE